MTTGLDQAVSRSWDKCIMSGRRPPSTSSTLVPSGWFLAGSPMPWQAVTPGHLYVSMMCMGSSERYMPLIPYLLCTGPGFLFLGNLPPSPDIKLHAVLQWAYTDRMEDHALKTSSPDCPDRRLYESWEKGRAQPSLRSSTAYLLPAGQKEITGCLLCQALSLRSSSLFIYKEDAGKLLWIIPSNYTIL